MNRDMPARAMDAEGVLAMLLGAIADASTDEGTRALLQDAADALQVATAVGVAERQRYRALFDAVPDPVSVIAWDGTVLDLNRAGIAAYRRERKEIIGEILRTARRQLHCRGFERADDWKRLADRVGIRRHDREAAIRS